VTNDKFRDYIQKYQGDKLREQKWIKDHSISFTFNSDEFLPNPDCKLFHKFHIEEYKHFPLEDI